METDLVLHSLGGWGRFQTLVFLVLSLIYMRGAWQTYVILFLGAKPDSYHCTLPNGTTHNQSSLEQHGYCMLNIPNKKEETCPYGFTYKSEFDPSIVTEWDLVCGKEYLVDLSTTIYMIGNSCGAALLTSLSDRFGRRLFILVCLFVQAAIGVGVAFVDSIILFILLRFFVGFINMAVNLAAFVMITELFPSTSRTQPSIFVNMFWSLGIMSLALFGYLLRNWRYLEILVSVPNAVLAFFCLCLPESLSWLIAKRKLQAAEKVIKRVAKFNNKPMPNLLFIDTESATRTMSDVCPVKLQDKLGSHHNSTVELRALDHDCIKKLHSASACDKNHVQFAIAIDQNCVQIESFIEKDQISESDIVTTDAQSSTQREPFLAKEENCIEMQAVNGDQNCVQLHALTDSGADSCSNTNKPAPANETEYTVLDLFRTPKIRRYSLIMFYLMFVNSLGYTGIMFSTPTLHGNQFLNLFISGAAEIPACLICMFALNWVGRRKPLAVFLCICGVMNIATVFIPQETDAGTDLRPLVITFVMIGKFGITGAYSTVYLYCTEIFPTVVRNHAVGISSFFENIGAIVAPFIVLGASTHNQLPLVLFGVLTLIGSILTFSLPETHQHPLPETIEEIDKLNVSSAVHPDERREITSL
ncbi:hypothetical protein CHS0354_021503 [Potamilus streckersoni]|uniref:Major facilitator superfamily (MFS) profile domain-containing protein n=1 Tax=Potamilus streckersoni TaxID=2493646 RepID=A0AAE0SBG4_9BIVA|nr:hypothetical protein CHS0354_021503 [Potamilus streckersoni]